MYGIKDTILPHELQLEISHNEWITDSSIALQNNIKSHDYNKSLFDKKLKQWEFKIGDMVYIENGNNLNRKKLDELKVGPYKIIGQKSKTIFVIDTGHRKMESNLYHITKLQPVPVKHIALSE